MSSIESEIHSLFINRFNFVFILFKIECKLMLFSTSLVLSSDVESNWEIEIVVELSLFTLLLQLSRFFLIEFGETFAKSLVQFSRSFSTSVIWS